MHCASFPKSYNNLHFNCQCITVSIFCISGSNSVTVFLSNKYRMIVHCHCNQQVSINKFEHIVINSLVI